MPRREIRIPAEQYDALELAANDLGGVGSGRWFGTRAGSVDFNCPVCINGLAHYTGITSEINASKAVGIETYENDRTVRRLIAQGHWHPDAEGVPRVPFSLLMKRLNVRRVP